MNYFDDYNHIEGSSDSSSKIMFSFTDKEFKKIIRGMKDGDKLEFGFHNMVFYTFTRTSYIIDNKRLSVINCVYYHYLYSCMDSYSWVVGRNSSEQVLDDFYCIVLNTDYLWSLYAQLADGCGIGMILEEYEIPDSDGLTYKEYVIDESKEVIVNVGFLGVNYTEIDVF